MQLLSLTLYNAVGEKRTVAFNPGKLNVVTGESRTGKSALLTIAEYCLGRSTMQVPAGPITDTVSWYGALWQLEDTRAFVARPAPAAGRASTSLAMLEFGTDLEPLDLADLAANTDAGALRQHLGRRIGIEENLAEPGRGSLRQPLEANLGHAALLCLQNQNEIASSGSLFHRQLERGLDDALRDTIPYFIGALPRDQALKRARLRDARRALLRAESALSNAQLTAGTIDTELRGLLAEARAVGLMPDVDIAGRTELVRALQGARTARIEPSPTVGLDVAAQDQRIALERTRDRLRADLRRIMADRALLLEQQDGEGGYEQALGLQASRLTSLSLLNVAEPSSGRSDEPASDGAAARPAEPSPPCPACRQPMVEADPTAAVLRDSLMRLRDQIGNMTAARPAQRVALQRLDAAATATREELSAAEAALAALLASDQAVGGATDRRREFTRGRIDAILSRVDEASGTELQRLQLATETAAAQVSALETELDDGNDREQLTSRLLTIGKDMTAYANRLQLEHSGESVRLDLARLTIVTDTERGPTPLFRIGSAENAVGYHLAAHLALHRYLVRQARPVPRFLMLDQPSQAYFPSEVARQRGEAESDADRAAVRRMFELIHDVVTELAPRFQVIVCDHANLPEAWFQDAVVHNWRSGQKLIPPSWLA